MLWCPPLRSFRSNAGLLHHLGPFYNFVLDKLLELIRRAGYDLGALLSQRLPGVRCCQDYCTLGGGRIDNDARCSCRRHEPQPITYLEIRPAGLRHCWKCRQQHGASGASTRQRPQFSALDMGECRWEADRADQGMPADQVVELRRAALVGNMDNVYPGRELE